MSMRSCRVCKKEIEAVTMGAKTCIECLNKTMTLEEEITELTAKWMKYVSLDHHKDRDCHWYITQTYSYGEEPYYEAHHSGYLLDHWTSLRCGSEEMASTLLRDKLKREIELAIIHLEDILKDKDSLEWLAISKEELEKIIKELK